MLLGGILNFEFYSPKNEGPRLKAFPHIHITTPLLSAAKMAFQGSNMAKEEARLQPFYRTQKSDAPGTRLQANNFVWVVLTILHPLQSYLFFETAFR